MRIDSWLVTPGCSQDVGNYRDARMPFQELTKKTTSDDAPPWSSLQKSSKCPKQQTPWCSTQPPLGCWQMCFIWGEKILPQVKGSWPLEISSTQKVDTFDVILMDALSRPSLLGIRHPSFLWVFRMTSTVLLSTSWRSGSTPRASIIWGLRFNGLTV